MSLSLDHSLDHPLDTSLDRPDLAPPPEQAAVGLRRIARGYARDLDLIAALPVSAHERTWLRLDSAPDVAAWIIRWPVGTSTGWHDHIGENGGVRGTFVVVDGLLLESTWSGHGALRRRLGPGGTRSFGPTYVHNVASIGDEPAISVHVYSPQLTAMRTYSVDGGELELTGIGPLDEW